MRYFSPQTPKIHVRQNHLQRQTSTGGGLEEKPLKVPGVLVELQSGLYFCLTEPVQLLFNDWFEIDGEDAFQLAEYGYPRHLEEKVDIELEPIESVWDREDQEGGFGFLLGWYPDQKNKAFLRKREAKAIASTLKEEALREEVRRKLRIALEGIRSTPE